jgi:phosphoribosylamine--glycine ligase
MRFLVVGTGGREHALVRALKFSPSVTEVHAAPGSAGIAQEAICHAIKLSDHAAWENLIKKHSFDCVVIGPEVPLAEGLADFLRAKGVATIGPNQTAARLESSKIFSKEFMDTAGVKTARYFVVDSVESCLHKANEFNPPYVLKADGLAAGKGVFICKTKEELQKSAHSIFVEKSLGDAGLKAVLEEFSPGFELSFLVLTNGKEFQAMPVSQDHKRLLDGDEGPNTGGMGVVGPVSIDEELRQKIQTDLVEPTLKHLSGLGLLYRGILYFGVMVTKDGPSLLEYNVRFGDPEAQVILPLLDGDWGQVFLQLASGELAPLRWKKLTTACVVMAAPGYPDAPEKDVVIEGDVAAQSSSSYFLHAGTKFENAQWKTSGGRVLNSMGLGSSLKEAIKNAYEQACKVKWRGVQMRKDIGAKVRG